MVVRFGVVGLLLSLPMAIVACSRDETTGTTGPTSGGSAAGDRRSGGAAESLDGVPADARFEPAEEGERPPELRLRTRSSADPNAEAEMIRFAEWVTGDLDATWTAAFRAWGLTDPYVTILSLPARPGLARLQLHASDGSALSVYESRGVVGFRGADRSTIR